MGTQDDQHSSTVAGGCRSSSLPEYRLPCTADTLLFCQGVLPQPFVLPDSPASQQSSGWQVPGRVHQGGPAHHVSGAQQADGKLACTFPLTTAVVASQHPVATTHHTHTYAHRGESEGDLFLPAYLHVCVVFEENFWTWLVQNSFVFWRLGRFFLLWRLTCIDSTVELICFQESWVRCSLCDDYSELEALINFNRQSKFASPIRRSDKTSPNHSCDTERKTRSGESRVKISFSFWTCVLLQEGELFLA